MKTLKRIGNWFVEPYELHQNSNTVFSVFLIMSSVINWWLCGILLAIAIFKIIARAYRYGFASFSEPVSDKLDRRLAKRNALIQKMIADRDVQTTVYYPSGAFYSIEPGSEVNVAEIFQTVWQRYHLEEYGPEGARSIMTEVAEILSPRELTPAQQLLRWRHFASI